jgi:competence protein ComEC
MGKIHFCKVGCGDCTVIQGGSLTFLIDCYGIENHAHLLPSSKLLCGVFITHQHTDHFAGMEYLKNNGYSIGSLIYSPYERRYDEYSVTNEEWQNFARLRDHFVSRGTKTYIPYRQSDLSTPFWDIDGISFRILAPFKDLAQSDTRKLHDACLVVHVAAGSHKFLVCGDASDASLNKIARNTQNYCNDVLRCSHHGSDNNADLDFLKGANAAYTVVSTESGVFQNVPGATAMQRYRDNTKQTVYRTDKDGTICWVF